MTGYAIGVLGVMGSLLIGAVLASGSDMAADKLWPRCVAISVIALAIAITAAFQ